MHAVPGRASSIARLRNRLRGRRPRSTRSSSSTAWSGRAAEWRDLGIVDRLATTHRVLSVDSLGHGTSDGPYEWEAYRAPAIGDDIVAAMDDAGVERASIWGYSRGAWMAAMVAAGARIASPP